jgi:hypothetical protein
LIQPAWSAGPVLETVPCVNIHCKQMICDIIPTSANKTTYCDRLSTILGERSLVLIPDSLPKNASSSNIDETRHSLIHQRNLESKGAIWLKYRSLCSIWEICILIRLQKGSLNWNLRFTPEMKYLL